MHNDYILIIFALRASQCRSRLQPLIRKSFHMAIARKSVRKWNTEIRKDFGSLSFTSSAAVFYC